jgi:hypothetical protein
MRNLMKRLDRLEQAAGPSEGHTMLVSFMVSSEAMENGPWSAAPSIQDDDPRRIKREPGETAEQFQSRAADTFAARPGGCSLVFLSPT